MKEPRKSNLKNSQHALDDANKLKKLNFYRFVIDSLPMAVMALDSSMKIKGFSPWAEKDYRIFLERGRWSLLWRDSPRRHVWDRLSSAARALP